MSSIVSVTSIIWRAWRPAALQFLEMLGAQKRMRLEAQKQKSFVYALDASLAENDGKIATKQDLLAKPA